MARHFTNCADWGYDQHPNRSLVTLRCQKLIRAILRNPKKFERFGHDTRSAHAYMFKQLTPNECVCILGTYRGAKSCKYVATTNVGVGVDRRVGKHYSAVAAHIAAFERRCKDLVELHKKWLSGPGATQSPAIALLKFVNILADILQAFLTIHPYMDGNGHSARLLIFVMMSREGYHPVHWDIDSQQPYSDELSAHRDGKKDALQKFLLKAITG